MTAVSGQNRPLKSGGLGFNRRSRSILLFWCSNTAMLQHGIDLLAAHILLFLLNIFSCRLSLRHDDCMCARISLWIARGRCYGWRWGESSVSALPWCRVCFPIACLWLIKHIDWPVSELEGWPTAALHATISAPCLSLGWGLNGKGNTGWKVMSAL